jgi:phage/plasmid-associated DNA primase
LKGKQGAGKGVFVDFLGSLFGEHYLAVSDSNTLSGRFNSQLEKTLLMFCDEAIFGGDRPTLNKMKALVTESVLNVEGKGIDAKQASNYINFIFASNEKSVLPIDHDNRRYMILDVCDMYSPTVAKDNGTQNEAREYWSKLWAETSDKGVREAFLGYVMGISLHGFNVRDFPHTEAEQAELSSGLDSAAAFMMHYIIEQENNGVETLSDIKANDFYSLYLEYCTAQKLNQYGIKSSTFFGRYLFAELKINRKRLESGNFYKPETTKNLINLFKNYHKIDPIA